MIEDGILRDYEEGVDEWEIHYRCKKNFINFDRLIIMRLSHIRRLFIFD